METFINSPLGAIHTLAATIAILFGAIVLGSKKGTPLHKKLGYTYVISMLVLNLSAIPITNMSGSVGLFHIFIAISLPTILLAMYYPLFSRHSENWQLKHFEFMFWSYVGLLAAFIAEVMVRLPLILGTESSQNFSDSDPSKAIGFAVAIFIVFIVIAIGEFTFRVYRKKWFG